MQFLQTLFSPNGWQLLGRFHVIIIHFPVALLITVAIVEAFSILRRRTTPAPAAFACLFIGTLAAITAATTGWAHADFDSYAANTLFYHRWLGITSAALALILLILHHLAKSGSIRKLRIYQLASFLTAIIVGITGHLGGTLTHGPDFLTITPPPLPTTHPSTTGPAAYVQIQPILDKACYECHGPAKQKASLRLDSPDAILKGGKNGPAIIPGDSEHSLLIRRCLGLDDKPSMPDNRPPLPADQIQLLRNWIDSLPTTLQPQTPPVPSATSPR